MNVMTICSYDWVDSHLMRFMRFARRAFPDSTTKYYVLIVGPPGFDLGRLDSSMNWIIMRNWFDGVQLELTNEEWVRKLVFYDMLRTKLLRTFELTEGLYVDPDVDILEDISHVQNHVPYANILYVPSPVQLGIVTQMCETWEVFPLYANIGMLYFRKGSRDEFTDRFKDVYRDARTEQEHPLVGSGIWNVILAQHSKIVQGGVASLGETHDVLAWDKPKWDRAKAIHFSGPQMKELRPYWVWHRTSGALEAQICHKPVQAP